MNLGKLLAAGRSIIGGRREISYRVLESAYLPKFISPKNPFAPPAKAGPASNTTTPPVKNEVAPDGKKTQKLPTFPAWPRKQAWINKLNPVFIWRRSPPSAAQKTPCPRQGELSLDRVKVVHNDLSDADVEVVPIKSRTAPGVEPALIPANGADSWSRLGAKIFGIKTA